MSDAAAADHLVAFKASLRDALKSGPHSFTWSPDWATLPPASTTPLLRRLWPDRTRLLQVLIPHVGLGFLPPLPGTATPKRAARLLKRRELPQC